MKFIAHSRRAGRTATCGLIMAAGLVMLALQAPAASVTLVASNSIWRYQADGSSQGTAWRSAAFDDSSWPAGQAKLGFGGDGETTPIGASTNGLTTFYFRHSFNNPGTNLFTQALARLLRDDGAVVYLNGVELFRQNMPTGAVDYLTIASSAVSGADENTFFATNIPAALALLQPGANVLAVEVHQSATNSSDLGFNFELTALTGSTPPGVSITNPSNGATFTAGENIEMSATASSDSGVAFVQFYANGLMIGGDAAAPYTATFRNPGFGSHTLMAVAQDLGGVRATSAVVNVQVVLHTNGATLIPNHACWSYWDRGTDPGADWARPDFDDSAWSMGFAELGYGDGDEATVVSFGTNAGTKHITTYFRRRFSVGNPSAFSSLLLRLKRDDGAVVYLNGTEVFRDNLPDGPIDSQTLAALAADDGAAYISTNISTGLLLPEQNTLAVEIHQNSVASSDISFDLQLVGLATVAPPNLRIARIDPSHVLLAWPASHGSNFVLQVATNLAPFAVWTPFAASPVESNGEFRVTATIPALSRFFRLCAPPGPGETCQPPLIHTQPLKVLAAPGSNVTLSVTATGTGLLTYQWRKNEQAILGATNSVLILSNAQRDTGGAYDLFVGNGCGCTYSCPVLVTVDGNEVTLPDSFAVAFQTNSVSGQVNASNAGATLEAGEPLNPVRSFGRTVWMRWTAPASGLAEFDTLGSGQGTSLAVYTGASVGTLQLRAADGPSLAAFSSRVQFQAVAGVQYHVAVDGFGQSTALCLNWNLNSAAPASTVIVVPLVDQMVLAGSNATFSVVATNFPSSNSIPIHYQWRFNGALIAGATNSSYTVFNAQIPDVGVYSVDVMGSGVPASSFAFMSLTSLSGPNSGTITTPTGQFTGSSTCGSVKFTKARGYCFRTTQTPAVNCPAPAWYQPGWIPAVNPSGVTSLSVSTVDPANVALDTAISMVPIPINAGCVAVCVNDNGGPTYPLLTIATVNLCTYGTVSQTAPPRVQTVIMYKVRTGFTAPANVTFSWSYY